MPRLSKVTADELSKCPKIITENVFWKANERGYRLAVKVLAVEERVRLTLYGVIGVTKRSFTLDYQGLPIRRYCRFGYHKDPASKFCTDGPHKHYWEPPYRDARIYVPDDINPDDDINEQFMQFLAEQNIVLKAGYQSVMLLGSDS